jgi:uncharacterized integral membrane protein
MESEQAPTPPPDSPPPSEGEQPEPTTTPAAPNAAAAAPEPPPPPPEPAREPELHRELGIAFFAKLLVLLFVVAYVIAFVVGNDKRISVDFVFATGRVTLIWAVLLVLLVGVFAGLLLSHLYRHRRRKQSGKP